MKHKKACGILCITLTWWIHIFGAEIAPDDKALLVVSIADLRAEPSSVPAELEVPILKNDISQQLSQVLFGERLIIDHESIDGKWCHVKALDQMICETSICDAITGKQNWIECPGYVEKGQLACVEKFPAYNIVLQALWTDIYSEKNEQAKIIISLPFGTMLDAKRVEDNWWEVYFLGEKYGYLKDSSNVYELNLQINQTEDFIRNKIVELAKKFIGNKYFFGGRSAEKKDLQNPSSKRVQLTGVDCSDFTNLAFKGAGLGIPKNSKSQYLGAPKKIEHGCDLKPGDLLFFESGSSGFIPQIVHSILYIPRICHVMLYIGNNQVIESTGLGFMSKDDAVKNDIPLTDLCVRIINLKDYLGCSVEQIESGKTTYQKCNYKVYMASYLSSVEDIQKLRLKCLGIAVD